MGGWTAVEDGPELGEEEAADVAGPQDGQGEEVEEEPGGGGGRQARMQQRDQRHARGEDCGKDGDEGNRAQRSAVDQQEDAGTGVPLIVLGPDLR